MKKTLSKGKMLLLLLTLSSSALLFGQEVASLTKLSTATQYQTTVTLESVLTEAQQKYGVFVNYKSDLVRNKIVDATAVNQKFSSIDELLNELLTPYNLKYERVEDKFYVVYDADNPPKVIPLPRAKPNTPQEQSYRSSVPSPLVNLAPTTKIADKTITGQVTDLSTGETLPGVNIVVKGTTVGTVTDIDGNYRLTVPDDVQTLVFSSVGYTREEVTIGNQTTINLEMAPDIQSLSEVVVVGYGTQKKSDLTGSVGSVSAEEIKAIPVTSVDQALQGRVPGVQVTQTSSAPGGGVSIRVRGASTLQGGNEPLYVIDGFPVYSSNGQASPSGIRGGTVASNALASLNPNDIESVEILKDASATAIYGSRGANGVVLITTKRGASGKPQVDFESYYGTQQLDKKYEVMSPEQLVRYANVFADNRGEESYYPNPPEFYRSNNTDWQDEIFQNAPIQNYQLGISGGNENTRYLMSGNYFNQGGIVKRSGFDRYSFRLNLDTDITDKLKVGNSLTITRSKYTVVPTEGDQGRNTGAVLAAIFMDPTLPIRREDGLFYTTNGNDSPLPNGSGLFNPSALINEVDDVTISNRILGNLFAEYTITDHLSFRTSFGIDQDNRDRDQYYTRYTRIGRDGPNSLAEISYTKRLSLLNENILKYNNTFNTIHQVDITAGYTWQNQEFLQRVDKC